MYEPGTLRIIAAFWLYCEALSACGARPVSTQNQPQERLLLRIATGSQMVWTTGEKWCPPLSGER